MGSSRPQPALAHTLRLPELLVGLGYRVTLAFLDRRDYAWHRYSEAPQRALSTMCPWIAVFGEETIEPPRSRPGLLQDPW